MRVALVSRERNSRASVGSGSRAAAVVQALESADVSVHVFGDVPTDAPSAVRSGPTDQRWWRLPLAIRAAHPDIVHVVGTDPGGILAAGWGASLARAPLVAEQLDDLAGRWRRLAARRPASVVTPSELVAARLQERSVAADRLSVVHPPVDYDPIERATPRNDVDVVFARRLDETANLETFLLALAQLRQRDWTAAVIGDGPRRSAYESLATDLRIDDRVSFQGRCALEERLAIYRGAHVFVQTARRCRRPTALARALACGCVGIVEYHADSCAHELIAGRERATGVTSAEDLPVAITDAASFEQRTLAQDRPFAASDVGRRYRELYAELCDE